MTKQNERTRELLMKHYQNYPALQIRDIFKFLYQSAFGCEHMVSCAEAAAEYLRIEYEGCGCGEQLQIDKLDGSYSRVGLSCMKQGLTAETFGKLFAASARKEPEGMTLLLQKLQTAAELAGEGLLPFSQDAFWQEAEAWAAAGYPAVHHSEVFRKTYHPAYRVIADRYVKYLPLLAELDRLLVSGPAVIAVEGGSASGKTTLGELLQQLYGCTVFHMDDFFLQPHQRTPERYAQAGGNVDRERFLEEVLQPLQRNDTVLYRRFDCSTFTIQPPVPVRPGRLNVIEGAYSMHPELSGYYDLSVFLEIDPQLQKERIEKRNTPEMAKRFFTEWIPLEQRYFEETQAAKRCSMRIQILQS